MSNSEEIHLYGPGHQGPVLAHTSPEYVQLSTAAAITVGLLPGQMYRTACTHCLNLLVTYPQGCRANCSYCGLARHREESRDYSERNFIRVDWPTVPYAELIEKIQQGADRGQFQRMCISMITHPKSDQDTLTLLQQWVTAVPQIPVSILSNPTSLEYDDLVEMKRLGADIFTVAIDAATPEIFERTRGASVQSPHRWDKYWQVLEWAAEIFGAEQFGAHIICGMGESEKEILDLCQRICDMGGHNHMFAFYPEQGSMMEDWPAVDKTQWRRVQLGRYLIDYLNVRVETMHFDAAGRVEEFGLEQIELDQIIASGTPFRTSGCPGSEATDISACNRPYGDSMPSDILSIPYAPLRGDIAVIQKQLQGEKVKLGPEILDTDGD
ncbi:MAG: radical SAM protein [Gammaproteobacteria bacterium]|nr:radical SAM protein [Gammaproteobacteria bacterium]